ncbi:Phosphoglucosamine mutase [Dissostichus eleginoides]|uniref:Phosphoglucosamine mutase n=1 Tax=Dissostichus eleginoides TaxID=100907 RepID=A0AAD9F983_DISEL|nr:Phosphoglucosamine mutase [Dissostichus eleginoides]
MKYEPLYVRRYWWPELPSFSTPHQGKGECWCSPQRYQEVGSTWRDTHRCRVVFPGNTGFSDVPSCLNAGYYHIHPTLV